MHGFIKKSYQIFKGVFMKERDCPTCKVKEPKKYRFCPEVFAHTRRTSCEDSMAVLATVLNNIKIRRQNLHITN